MKIILTALALLSISSASFAIEVRGDAQELYKGQTPDGLMMNYMKKHNVPGMQVAIVQAPYIPREVGMGVSNVKTKQLFSPKTIVPVGQLTEAFTSVAIMQLVDSNKMSLDDKIEKYVKSLPSGGGTSLLRVVVGSSGLPNYTKSEKFNPQSHYTPKQLLALVDHSPLLFKTGTSALNSN